MDSSFRKGFIEILGRRAQLSMLGKGVIGLIGGTLVLIITFFRKCNDREPLETKNADWIEAKFINPALHSDSAERSKYYNAIGIPDTNMDSISNYIKNRSRCYLPLILLFEP